MSTPPLPGTSDSFNGQGGGDPVSAPPMPQNPVMQSLQKKKPFKNARNPGALAGAIARAKRANQPSYKYGN